VPKSRMNPKHIQRLSDVVSLIAYADPATSPVAHYLSQEQRERTAQALNSFILCKCVHVPVARVGAPREAHLWT
jgi:hypothetical protein